MIEMMLLVNSLDEINAQQKKILLKVVPNGRE